MEMTGINVAETMVENMSRTVDFAEEIIMETIRLMYPEVVIESTLRYCEVGKYFYRVAREVYRAYKDVEPSAEYDVVDGVPVALHDEEFFMYYLDRAAYFAAESIVYKKDIQTKPYWENMDLTIFQEEMFRKLSRLEQKIISLTYGLSGEGKHSPEKIARLDDFNGVYRCDPAYISRLLNWDVNEFKKEGVKGFDALNPCA